MWKSVKEKFFEKEKKTSPFLIVGLGNPKDSYEKTTHNAGTRIVSILNEEENFPFFSRDNTVNGHISKSYIEDKEVILMKPFSFMNLSGGPVKKAVKKFNIDLEKLLIVHDDTDLPIGKVRFSYSRGAAGHNGVLSVIKALGTKDFWRLRVGVSLNKNEKAKNIVLKNLPKEAIEVEKEAAEELKKTVLSGLTNKTVETKV